MLPRKKRSDVLTCGPAATCAMIGLMLALVASPGWAAGGDADLQAAVTRHLQLPTDGIGGAAVVVRRAGHTSFFNFGTADGQRPITEQSLFNLASIGKAFTATLLAQAVEQREVALGDPVAKYVTGLAEGGDIRRVTLRELASHTSGLTRTPGQYEKWHRGSYALPDFIRYLDAWRADDQHMPGKQFIYSNSAFALLQLALQRRFRMAAAQLMQERLLARLAMNASALPVPAGDSRGDLAPALRARAVQGYGVGGRPIGQPGNEEGAFDWPGTGQMYSSAQDMAQFLAANLGEIPGHRPLQQAMSLAHQGVFTVGPRFTQALAWQVIHTGDHVLIDKNGGLDNTSTYIGFMPQERLGVVVLINRGGQRATRIGREILLDLAGSGASPNDDDGVDGD